MVTNPSAPSVEVLGLVAVKLAIEPDPLAEFYGHGPFHTVEQAPVWLEDAHETIGQLTARLGCDEGESFTVRCATVDEQRARLATVLANAPVVLKSDGSTRCPSCGGFTLHFEDCPRDPGGLYASWTDTDVRGRIAYLEAIAAEDDDNLSSKGYAELHALQAERERRSTEAAR